MPWIIPIVVFVTVVLVVFSFGAAVVTPSSVLGARLRALGGQQQPAENKPAFRERIEQAMDPISPERQQNTRVYEFPADEGETSALIRKLDW